MKRKLYLLLSIMILIFLLLNGILFYSTKLSAEYLQSKNVWGETQAIRLSDYRRQSNLLISLPKDPAKAEILTDQLLSYVKRQQQLRNLILTKWRMEELSAPPKELEGNALLNDLQEEDYINYDRLHSLLYGVSHYKEYVENVEENADSVISLLYPLGKDEKNYNNALQCKRDFSDVSTLVLVPVLDNGVNLILQYHVTDFLAFLLLIMISLLFYYYLKKQALLMAENVRSLTGTMLAFFFFGILGLYLTNLLITRQVLDFPSFQIPLQSLEAFYSCPYRISLGGFLILWLLFKLCTLLFILFLCMLAISGKRPYLTLPAVLLLFASEYFASRLSVDNSSFDLFREINLFSGITSERFFNRYLNITIQSQALPRIWLFLFIFTIPFIVISFFTFRRIKAFWDNAQAAMHKAYSDEIDKQYQETRRLWHDFNNHLLTIKALYGTGHSQEAEEYIEKLSEESQKRLLPAKTGSNAVDLLLFQKVQKAREKEIRIRFTISCDLKQHGFRDYDLCSLLGNLLDNALEASQAVTEKEPEIKLRMEARGNMLFISCENEFRGDRKQKGDQFLTTKKETSSHGLGLLSVKQITNKYGGTMETLIQGETFLITVLLNDKKQ